jgi:hypothetical protein
MNTRFFGDFCRAWYGPPRLEAPAPAIVPEQKSAGPQMGATITCTEETGVFRPCSCGSTDFVIAPGAGAHAAQLVCAACHRGGRWLRRSYFMGAPDAP